MRRLGLCSLLVLGCVNPEQARDRIEKNAEKAVHEVEDAVEKTVETTKEVVAPEPEVSDLDAARLRSPIKPDEEVVLFPSIGWFEPQTKVWRVPLHGWIYEPEEEDMVRSQMLRGLSEFFDEDQLENEILQARLKPFLYDNERGKEIVIEVGDSFIESSPSRPNGHFEGLAAVSEDTALKVALQRHGRSPPPLLPIRAVPRPRDKRSFETNAYLLGPTGLLIISDIDDTVKVSHCTDKARLMSKTFLEPFEAVPGMAEVYAEWFHEGTGSHLHFVSSSPWQLMPELERMLNAAGFAGATYELKSIRLKDPSVADLFADPVETKTKPITQLLDRFPGRTFVLVGDSGEKDPEVYGELARKYPEQITYIAIRNVTDETPDSERMSAAFANVKARWELFTDPATLSGP